MTAHVLKSLREMRHEMRADYSAGKRSRHVRERMQLGGSGDAHYAQSSQFDRIREYARDMDRNDAFVGPLIDTAVTSQLKTGFRLEPTTGNKKLNEKLKGLFVEWASDPRACDHHWERTFWEMCIYALREQYIDGDIFSVLTDHGAVQMLEADRCMSPDGRNEEIVHGVELAGRRKVGFWFSADQVPTARGGRVKVTRVPAYDDDGERVVLHLYNPKTVKRITQARGVSSLASVFFKLGMHEDIEFATLVKQQVAAAFAISVERDASYNAGKAQFGTQTVETDGSNTTTLEAVEPGMIVRGSKGEKISTLSSNVPSNEYLEHTKTVLTEISVNLGVPLVMATMDASSTNFSGFRGAMELAREGFRVMQKSFVDRKLRPVYRWKVRQWVAEGKLTAREAARPDLLAHTWRAPRWPYIQPLHDAQANALLMSTGQMSPSGWAGENGADWEEHATDIVRDWELLADAAMTAAKKLSDKHGVDVHWRDVANMETPTGLTLSGAVAEQTKTGEPVDA